MLRNLLQSSSVCYKCDQCNRKYSFNVTTDTASGCLITVHTTIDHFALHNIS